jgi:hypothetical protein
VTAVAAAILGTFAAWHYHTLGLTLSHYDARGHLVVARRIFDSITPGWQQIGAVWLPLPHLLNAVPVQIDLLYRTGASAVAISIASYAVTTAAVAWIVRRLTGSAPAAVTGAAVFALNPNVVYLQSTPMTEPLLLATTTSAVAMLIAASRYAGIGFALACLTRYEAWPVTATALTAAGWVRWRGGEPLADAVRGIGRIAMYPAVAIVGFSIVSRVIIGEWFVSGGFFVPENKALGDAWLAAKEIGWGAQMLSGPALTWIGGIGLVIAVTATGIAPRRANHQPWMADALVAISPLAMAAIPWAAFYRGHPFRIRYMVPLMAVEAIGAGVAAGVVPRRATLAAAVAVAAVGAYELRPLDRTAPMIVEAQWDRPNQPERARVTGCIAPREPGAKIMASMGSLGHYMQEASHQGFAIRDFLHEGNGDIWLAALERPHLYADWLLIEEKAEGGDMLARIAHERPSFLAGYARVCDGAGVALYRRMSGDASDSPEASEGTASAISDARPR